MGREPYVTRREFMKDSVSAGTTVLMSRMAGATPLRGERTVGTPGNEARNSYVLENELIRVEVSRRNGGITGLLNKRTGREYISAPRWARSFRLNVPDRYRVTGHNADWSANALDSWRQANCTIATEKKPASQTLTVYYPELESPAGKFPIEVQYSVHLPDDSEDVFLKLSVVNRSRFCINDVFFPWISGVGAVEGVENDTFVVPNVIRSIPDLRKDYGPGAEWEEHPYLMDVPMWPSRYSLSMPWMNYGGKTEGLYLASLTRVGIRHMLMIQDFSAGRDPIFAFAWAFPPYIEPGKSWQTPEMLLSLHAGDWHAAADKYRASLEGWYTKPDLTPDSMRSFASYNRFFVGRDFMEIAGLAKDIRKHGLKDLIMWNFGDYYPNVTEEDDLAVDPPRLGEFTPQWGGLARLKEANRIAATHGVQTGIIFSQRHWNTSTLTPELRKLAERWVMRTPAGDPQSQFFVHHYYSAAPWTHNSPSLGYLLYMMCDAVREYQEFAIHNIVGVLSQGGYSTMFFDCAIENQICFSPEHNHSTCSAPLT